MSEICKGLKEIAQQVKYGVNKTRRFIKSGELPVWQDLPDPAYRISREALREWVRERERVKRAVQ